LHLYFIFYGEFMAKVGIVLLSGGLDSATVAAIARNEGYDLHAMSRCE
jgi:7-cyano-7-deazaguanine synthase in queuosine biosynthesis